MPLVGLAAVPKPVDVYLLGGQSNATGQGYLANLPQGFAPDGRVLLFHAGGHLHSGAQPNTWIPLRQASESPDRFGPELGFGNRMQELCPTRKLAIIKHAYSGTNLHTQWAPGKDAADRGHFTQFVATVEAGLQGLREQGYTPTIRGMLWQQGESDAKGQPADRLLEVCRVQRNCVAVLFFDGRYADTLPAGLYTFWKGAAEVWFVEVDLRETLLDIGGQEILTADNWTLRLNAVATYRVTDAQQTVIAVDDVRQALYREAQLALRAVVGARELDTFLTAKDGVTKELEELLGQRAVAVGVEIAAVGIRDVILPGEMKELMNKVTEAKKAAEANLVARREETAAMRSQANTARLLDDNPTLMRLRELEVLERVAASGKLNVVLGEKGLAERVVNLL